MLNKKVWEFQKQEGSGYFFEKDHKTIIAGTQMWTGKYVIVQIPKEWKE
ncbi:hypothetical protein [Metabacillus sp. Hm71]